MSRRTLTRYVHDLPIREAVLSKSRSSGDNEKKVYRRLCWVPTTCRQSANNFNCFGPSVSMLSTKISIHKEFLSANDDKRTTSFHQPINFELEPRIHCIRCGYHLGRCSQYSFDGLAYTFDARFRCWSQKNDAETTRLLKTLAVDNDDTRREETKEGCESAEESVYPLLKAFISR